MFTPTLYYSPGAISLVTHIAFEELGLAYQPRKVMLAEREHLTETYRKVHPLSRVPAVEISPGQFLTETPALLWYLDEQAPSLNLMPRDALTRARANEWMSLLVSGVHVSFITFFRPERYTKNEAAMAALKLDGKERFWDMLLHVESKLPESGFVLGDRYTLCDAFLTVPYLWAKRFEMPMAELPRYSRLVQSVLPRPAVRCALEQEGFGQLYQ